MEGSVLNFLKAEETLLPVAAMFVNDRDKMSNPYREPSIYASYQVSVHLAKQFQRRRFLEINQLETVLYKDCSFYPDH
jgi:hypothetical protein